jgi:hypothetical protein
MKQVGLPRLISEVYAILPLSFCESILGYEAAYQTAADGQRERNETSDIKRNAINRTAPPIDFSASRPILR